MKNSRNFLRHSIPLFIVVMLLLSACAAGNPQPETTAATQEQAAQQNILDITVAEVQNNCDAIYTLISDDGVYESGIILNDLVTKLDMRATVAGYSGRLNLFPKEWQAISDQGYVEVISHSYSHKKMADTETISDEEYYHEIYESRVFTEELTGKPLIAFVCPNNEMTQRGYTFLKESGYFAVRRGTRGLNSLNPEEGTEPFQWFNLGCYGIGDEATEAGRDVWVDNAILEQKWLIEMWHDISPDGSSGYQGISTADAETHLNYIAELRNQGKLWVASFQDAVQYIRERQNAQVKVEQTGEMEARISLTCDRAVLPASVFQMPLTLNVEVPENWDYVFVTQNGKACQVKRLDQNRISFHAIPDGGEIVIGALEQGI